jgi:endonuclease-3
MKQLSLVEKKQRVGKIIRKLKELFPLVKSALNYSNNWEFLVAVILSAQTTDKMVNRVTENLFKKYLTLEDYIDADPKIFERDIHSVNFHRNKTKNILCTATIIKNKYKGKIPETMEDLISLPGVGRKTANVILGNAFNKPMGIAVDTHVKRLTKLLGLTSYDDPHKIEKDLQKIVPKEDWTKFTHLMIEYGRNYCPARKHDHSKCPLSSVT